MKERKTFQPLPHKENQHFLEDGIRIYNEMREKYPNDTIEDLDNILNGLCASLAYMIQSNVSASNHKQFLQLVYKTLYNNVTGTRNS